MSSVSRPAPSAQLPVGVYRFRRLIDGHVAYYSVDWAGRESPPRIVEDDELETDVIADMGESVALDHVRPPLRLIGSSRPDRPSSVALLGLFSRR